MKKVYNAFEIIRDALVKFFVINYEKIVKIYLYIESEDDVTFSQGNIVITVSFIQWTWARTSLQAKHCFMYYKVK